MRSNDYTSDPSLFLARRHKEFDVANTCPPNISITRSNLLKPLADDGLWLEPVPDSAVLQSLDLGLYDGVVCRSRECELSRHKMPPVIAQSNGRNFVMKRIHQFRTALNFRKHVVVTR